MSANSLRSTSEIQDPVYYYQCLGFQFLDEILPNAITYTSLIAIPVPSINIWNVLIASTISLPWTVWFFGDTNYGTGLVDDTYMCRVNIDWDTHQIGGAGVYYSQSKRNPALGLNYQSFPMPYYCIGGIAGQPGFINLGLQVNGGANPKPAGVPVIINIFYTPMGEAE